MMAGAGVTTWNPPTAPAVRHAAALPWIAGGALALVSGLAAALVHPALGLAVVGLLAAPLFVLAPSRALLLFAAVVPFEIGRAHV